MLEHASRKPRRSSTSAGYAQTDISESSARGEAHDVRATRRWRPSAASGAVAPTSPRMRALPACSRCSPGVRSPTSRTRWSVDPALVHRWVRGFVEAGTAQVTNTPTAEAASQRDRFLTAFAHELRTPLAVAQGWVAMLDEGDVPPSMLEDTVVASTARCLVSPNASSTWSCSASRRSGGVRFAADRDHRRRARPRAARSSARSAGAGPEVEVCGRPGPVPAGAARPVGGRIPAPDPRSLRLEVTELSLWVDVRIVRDADPIDPQVLQALFEPFDTNDDDTGVTIGLYLARALTVAHGGTVGVDQDEHGAALWVRIPRRSATHDRVSDPVEE